jgi:uncharacterized protein
MIEEQSLAGWFREAGTVLLGYSGGVDSAVLAVAGTRALGPGGLLAVIGRSASYPEAQWITARTVAAEAGVRLEEVATGELDDPRYRANAPDRCYFCKAELWTRLGAIARDRGIATVIDGPNLDDLREHRPGRAAGAERSVRSPFVELGWNKTRVREAARHLGLPVWDAPAAPCLSSRIAYGLEVTAGRLRQVELAEAFLRTLGVVGDLRVRHHGGSARIEVRPEMFETVDRQWPAVRAAFTDLGFETVDRDPAGYRRGSLLPIAS